MPVEPRDLEKALKAAFPEMRYLEIMDTSSGCGSSYAVIIVNPTFEGKMTLARHRWVNELLKEEIAQMHAFSQKTYTPKEWEAIKAKNAAAEAARKAEASV
ncbi:hypothetical protein FS837_003551 [Tulasnella sp. UAMH 9824]|nr:hypothetical protein FS837_003551 [Tulasnella sp. UAMH 9824]